MAESFTVLDPASAPAQGSLTDKKSEFIADICHVDELAQAVSFVETIRERHPKARHADER